MKYTAVVISVADVAAARKFYEELFGLEVYQDHGRNLCFTCGLALQQDFGRLVGLPQEKVQRQSNNIELCFEERDFDGFLEKLKRYPGIRYLGGVIEQDWGQRVVRFYDPDGHLIEVGEEMKKVVWRFLDAGMTLEEVSARMDVTVADLTQLLDS